MNIDPLISGLWKATTFLRKARVSKREFCFWIIPAGETSQIKKVRISAWKLFTGLGIATAILSLLVVVAVDYLRVQGLRAKNYALWKRSATERDSVIGDHQDLLAKLNSYEAAAKARDGLDSEIENTLTELADFIGDSKAVAKLEENSGKAGYRTIAKAKGGNSHAIGGLEKACSPSGCSVFEQDLFEAEDPDQAARATYKPESLLATSNSENQLSRLTESLKILRAIPLLFPTRGDLSSGFGYRWSPFEHGVAMHEGLDFAAAEGTAVGSAGDGVVKEVERNSTYGLVVDIEHTARITTRYAHLSSALVKKGEKVMRGDLLGQVGSTGRSTGPHLHYEVILDGRQVDPKIYLGLSDRLAMLLNK